MSPIHLWFILALEQRDIKYKIHNDFTLSCLWDQSKAERKIGRKKVLKEGGINLSTIKWFMISLPLYYQYIYFDIPYKLDSKKRSAHRDPTSTLVTNCLILWLYLGMHICRLTLCVFGRTPEYVCDSILKTKFSYGVNSQWGNWRHAITMIPHKQSDYLFEKKNVRITVSVTLRIVYQNENTFFASKYWLNTTILNKYYWPIFVLFSCKIAHPSCSYWL